MYKITMLMWVKFIYVDEFDISHVIFIFPIYIFIFILINNELIQLDQM